MLRSVRSEAGTGYAMSSAGADRSLRVALCRAPWRFHHPARRASRGLVLRTSSPRAAVVAAAFLSALALPVPARAQAPTFEVVPAFSARSVLPGQPFTISGVLPGGAADAGRPVQLFEASAPFTGAAYAMVAGGTAGPGGEFGFPVLPVFKAYWAVVAPETAGRPREASQGYLVAVRRKVSIKTSTRRPRTGALVRFSGFVAPAFTAGPDAVATLQRRTGKGGYRDVRSVAMRAAGTVSSYRVSVHVPRAGVYRVLVPSTATYSQGASVAVTVHVRR
jgi:hypothetical protein